MVILCGKYKKGHLGKPIFSGPDTLVDTGIDGLKFVKLLVNCKAWPNMSHIQTWTAVRKNSSKS